MIVNFNQTGLPIIPIKDWTIEQEDTKQVPMYGANNKLQIIAVLGTSATGPFLIPQLIYEDRFLLSFIEIPQIL